jgi:GGDEF domain-containing protein
VSDHFPDPRLAERLTRAARAAQALSEALWEALQEELADPRPERVAELSEQLGEVAAVVASLARVDLRAREPGEDASRESARPRTMKGSAETAAGAERASAEPVERGSRAGEPRVARAPHEEPYGLSVEEPARTWEATETETPSVPAVLIDELAAELPSPAEFPSPIESAPEPLRAPESSRTPESLHHAPEPPRARTTTSFAGAPPARPDTGRRPREDDPPRRASPEIASPEIEIRDERSAEGPTAWIDSIGRRLERYEQDRSPFAVLLVELVDIERLRHAEPAEELARLIDRVENALARVLRPADTLTRERPGRYWLLAPRTDGPGGHALVEQVASAVRTSVSHRGTPLEVAMGVAVCPEDGRRASELAAHADVGLYAARAAGRPSIG